MSKLNALFSKLNLHEIPVHVGPVYLLFTDPATGQPSTVIEHEDCLIVSGNKPGAGTHKYDKVDDCLNHTFFVNAHG